MSTGAALAQQDQLSLEQKIAGAAAEASAIVAHFSPAAGVAIAAGAEVEPIVGAMVKMFIHLFEHHAKKAIAAPLSSAQPIPAGL